MAMRKEQSSSVKLEVQRLGAFPLRPEPQAVAAARHRFAQAGVCQQPGSELAWSPRTQWGTR